MKSITIHKLDPRLANAIEEMASTLEISQNKAIQMLLKKALGMNDLDVPKKDFSEFCGLWSEKEAKEFDRRVKDFDRVDEEMWS